MVAYSLKENAEASLHWLQVAGGAASALAAIGGVLWALGVGRAIKRRRDRRRADFLADIAGVVAPMIDASRAAAVAQHDEQNVAIRNGFVGIHQRIDELDERLDKGAERLAAHDVRLAVIEARSPSTRSRKDDHQ